MYRPGWVVTSIVSWGVGVGSLAAIVCCLVRADAHAAALSIRNAIVIARDSDRSSAEFHALLHHWCVQLTGRESFPLATHQTCMC